MYVWRIFPLVCNVPTDDSTQIFCSKLFRLFNFLSNYLQVFLLFGYHREIVYFYKAITWHFQLNKAINYDFQKIVYFWKIKYCNKLLEINKKMTRLTIEEIWVHIEVLKDIFLLNLRGVVPILCLNFIRLYNVCLIVYVPQLHSMIPLRPFLKRVFS